MRLPLVHGVTRMSTIGPRRVTAISPYPGQSEAVAAVSGGFPAPGEVRGGALRLVWAGHAMALAFGEGLPEGLGQVAAVVDQSDGWAGVTLEGEGAQAVLARLVAIDLRALPAPASARGLLGHLPLLLIKESATRFEIWSYRSMAGSLVHELEAAMRNVAARRSVG
jgi:sarcosine oxidase subunit gamma